MALSGPALLTRNPAHSQIQSHNRRDIHGVVRTSCSNCTECPQFISIPGHVLCAYCGCPPARHGKGAATTSTAQGERKRGRPRDSSQDSLASTALGRSTPSDSDQSDSDETSSGVSSFASGRQRRARRWRPSWQVTAPPPRVSRLLAEEAASHEEALEHGWSAEDSSPNIFLKPEDLLTFHRNPVYQTTDAIRGRGCSGEVDHPVGYRSGLHIWSVSWPLASRGTHPVVGVATSSCPLTEPGYRRLVGSNSSSWGWCLKTLKVYHDSRKYRHGVSYPRDVDEKLRVPETFYMLLDMDRGTLAFQVSNDFLGVAFSGLRGEELFPIVSAVWGHCEVTLTYINSHHFDRDSSPS